MTVDFATVLAAPPSGRNTAVLLDHQSYAQAVLLRGREIPWADPVGYAQFLRQAQGLLNPDTTLLDLGAYYANAVAANPELRAALSARSRRGFALKTLLADQSTAAAALELAEVVSRTSAAPLVLQIPSPMLWLAITHESAGAGTVADLDADSAENAAMYVADWLRRFASLPVSLLLLDERWPGAGELPVVDTGAYTPVSNVTAHYRWTVARRTAEVVQVLGSHATGSVVPQQFWLADTTGPVADPMPDGAPGNFLIAEIPAAAVPETVLLRLAALV